MKFYPPLLIKIMSLSSFGQINIFLGGLERGGVGQEGARGQRFILYFQITSNIFFFMVYK